MPRRWLPADRYRVRWKLSSVHRLRSGWLLHEHGVGVGVGGGTPCRLLELPWLLPPEPPNLGHGDCGDAQLRSWAHGPAQNPAPWVPRRGGRASCPSASPLVLAAPLRGPSPGPSVHAQGPVCLPRPGGSDVPQGDPRVGPVGSGVWPPPRWSWDLTRPHDLQHLLPVRCPRLLPWCGFCGRLVPLCRWLPREPVPGRRTGGTGA